MCRVDGDECYTMLTEADRKARKEHACLECGRPINAGETYRYEVGVLYGDMDVMKTCSHCVVARSWLSKNCGGWIYSEVIDEIREHAEEYPALAMPLLRIVVGARQKWRRRAGDLMPIPAMPPSIEARVMASH